MPYKLAMTIPSLRIRKLRLGRLSQLSKGHNKEGTRPGFYCFMAEGEEMGLELLFFFLLVQKIPHYTTTEFEHTGKV